jgi:predicted HicB family RNase H-like nuclease
MARINIEINKELHKKLKIICAIKDITISKYIHDAIEEKNGRRIA